MERDDFTKDFTKGNSLKWVPRLASLEVVAEQILHYFKPDANQKNLMQLLLLFELGKGYFRLKALFSGNETILMEEQLFTFYLAEKRRNGFLKQKADDIKNLTKSNSKYASKEALLTQIKAVLGVKIKEKEAPKEGQVKDVENPAPALPPTDETVYVEDKENVVDRFCFNEEFKENLPRTGKLNGILKSIPIPEAFKKSYPLPSTIKISECLRILRPIFHCILLSVTAPNSFKPITVSLLMDLAILLLRIGYKKQTQAEVQEMKKRNKDLLLDYLLRKPIFTLLVQPYILEPLVKKVVPIEWVSSMIISTLLWRSSYCMNL